MVCGSQKIPPPPAEFLSANDATENFPLPIIIHSFTSLSKVQTQSFYSKFALRTSHSRIHHSTENKQTTYRGEFFDCSERGNFLPDPMWRSAHNSIFFLYFVQYYLF